MADTVHLHIGAPKSGTTYLQTVLWRSRRRLRHSGVLVPGQGLGDYNRAAVAMRVERQGNGKPARTWRAMLEEVHAFDGDVVLSGEWFCLAPEHLIGRTIEQLAPARVHLVYSARAFVPQVAAAWQETIKLGSPTSLDDFVAGLEGDHERWSWWSLDPRQVLQRWLPHVPAADTTVVTVPAQRTHPGQLLERFADAFGIDVTDLDTSKAVANESLGVEAAEVLRMVAPRVKELVDFSEMPWTDEYRWLRRYLSHDLLVPRPGNKIALSQRDVEGLGARSAQVAQWLRDAGVGVSGDLDDLVVTTNPAGSVHPSDVDPTRLVEVAAEVMAALVRDVRAATLAHEATSEGTTT